MTRTEFGRMLQQARIDKDMSLRRLGALVGCRSATYVANIESGKAAWPSPTTVFMLAVVLDQDPDMWCLHAGYCPLGLLAALMQRPERVQGVIRYAEQS